MPNFFLSFTMQFNRDIGLDWGRISLNSLTEGTKQIWLATASTSNKQEAEDFNQKGGPIPPQYRCGIKNWIVDLKPIPMLQTKGVEGNFYKINPHEVLTDKGTVRGDFGIHRDANVPGSLGCIVLTDDRFKNFELEMKKLTQKTILTIPLFVQYS